MSTRIRSLCRCSIRFKRITRRSFGKVMVKVTRETRVTAAAAETVLMFGRAAATTTAPTAATKLYAHCPPREEECTDKGFRSKKGAKLNVYSGFFCHAGGMLCTRSTYCMEHANLRRVVPLGPHSNFVDKFVSPVPGMLHSFCCSLK